MASVSIQFGCLVVVDDTRITEVQYVIQTTKSLVLSASCCDVDELWHIVDIVGYHLQSTVLIMS